jgi:glycosyltransferase involved in cell wall biosynthesis
MPKISVIIPAYNIESHLAQAIESVLNQTFTNVELIVVDDGSVDATFSLAKSYEAKDSRVRAYSFPNAGAATARNRGIEKLGCATDFVMFLDADDFLEPNALAALLETLVQNPAAVAAYGVVVQFEDGTEPKLGDITRTFGYNRPQLAGWRMVSLPHDSPTTFSTLVIWDYICTPGQLLMRKSALDQVGKFDPEIAVSEDWEFMIRLAARGPLIYVRKHLLNKRELPNSYSRNNKLLGRAEPKIRKKFARSSFYSKAEKKKAILGHFYSCFVKFGWVRDDLKEKQYSRALRDFYQALKGIGNFIIIQIGNLKFYK